MAMFETPEEKRIREAAEAKQKAYEASTGEQVPEEAGIEPDYTLEDTAMSLMGGGGVAAKAGRYAAGKVKDAAREKGKGILSKVLMPDGSEKHIGGGPVAPERPMERSLDYSKINSPSANRKPESPGINYSTMGDAARDRLKKKQESVFGRKFAAEEE